MSAIMEVVQTIGKEGKRICVRFKGNGKEYEENGVASFIWYLKRSSTFRTVDRHTNRKHPSVKLKAKSDEFRILGTYQSVWFLSRCGGWCDFNWRENSTAKCSVSKSLEEQSKVKKGNGGILAGRIETVETELSVLIVGTMGAIPSVAREGSKTRAGRLAKAFLPAAVTIVACKRKRWWFW